MINWISIITKLCGKENWSAMEALQDMGKVCSE